MRTARSRTSGEKRFDFLLMTPSGGGGGFLGRKHDGEPGARTIWLGTQEIAVFVKGARYARQFNDG
jgi:hypothetical protein